MSSSTNPLLTSSSLFLSFLLFISISQASVPPENQFKHVNEGEFGPFIVEYDGFYRDLMFARAFQLAFYNTTPNAYTLAIKMATRRSESLYRWVWEANRGNPVRENATFSLGSDGNLVLADADGRVAWQTGTANKGVVGCRLLQNGNLVLYDSKGHFVWQSFDSPTDTLLVGQSLRRGGRDKLVSRASDRDNVDGPYSLVLEPKRLALYYKSKNSPRPVLYFSAEDWFFIEKGSLEFVRFKSYPVEDVATPNMLTFEYGTTGANFTRDSILVRPKYNSTLSIVRLEMNGDLRFHTFFDTGVFWGAWEVTFTLFDRRFTINECQLPERCGKFGLCEESQCVACPLSSGLMGWSEDCEPVKVGSCNPKDFSYYKLVGVDHFMSRFTRGSGPTKESDCGAKCTSDCKCLGYFYHQVGMRCWIAYDLNTLTKTANSTHVGYIKAPKP